MTILTIAGYRFVDIELAALAALRQHFLTVCQTLDLKGTVLLSQEGMNLVGLSGSQSAIKSFKAILAENALFAGMPLHETFSDTIPFKKLKIKIKKEIITFKKPTKINTTHRAPCISPATFKQWLDEKKDITLLDTRNTYEIDFGTFENAINPEIKHFTELANKINLLDCKKPLVMFCTGGIRCEKAASYCQAEGFEEVYQLDGGILAYLKLIGGAHWQGACFVFDDRIALDTGLNAISTI